MRIKRTLEPLYDWFDDATVTRIDDETYDVRIMGNELAAFWWALQYADTRLIGILSPQSLRVRLHDVGVSRRAVHGKDGETRRAVEIYWSWIY